MAPLDFISRFIHYYTKSHKDDPPLISTSTAVGLSVVFTLIYVIPFYLSSKTRPSPQLSRDAPSVVQARIRAVTFSCILTCAITTYVALHYGEFTILQLFHTFGLWPIDLFDLLRAMFLVAILFCGPLFERAIVEGEWRDWIRGRGVVDVLSSYIGWRTYIVGPASEEFVWRALVIPLHLLAKIHPTKIVFLTPLYFGIAHIHHCYEFKLTHPNTPLLPAIMRSVFQFAYTSLFGFYAAFIFLRTGSLWAAILAHSFCNWMGLPRFWGMVEAPLTISTPDTSRKIDDDLSDNDEAVDSSYARLSVGWTIAYYGFLVFGAAAFYRNMYDLTESRYALVPNWP